MRAVYIDHCDPADPAAAITVGDINIACPHPDWVPVDVRAAALNHHDLWSARGMGLGADQLPMVLGTDAAGFDPQGRRVVVHAVVGQPGPHGDETLDPQRTLLSERYPGALAEQVWVPRGNLVLLPHNVSFEAASCLPTAYLTAYRMVFTRARMQPGQRLLIQGAGGGVATAALLLATAAGIDVTVTARDPLRGRRAVELGASSWVASGSRLPEPVDAVIETVGAATWEHSLRAVRPGGTIVVCGATSGSEPPAALNRVFFRQISILGSTMGSVQELTQLVHLVAAGHVNPLIDTVAPLDHAQRQARRLQDGGVSGKVVLLPSGGQDVSAAPGV